MRDRPSAPAPQAAVPLPPPSRRRARQISPPAPWTHRRRAASAQVESGLPGHRQTVHPEGPARRRPRPLWQRHPPLCRSRRDRPLPLRLARCPGLGQAQETRAVGVTRRARSVLTCGARRLPFFATRASQRRGGDRCYHRSCSGSGRVTLRLVLVGPLLFPPDDKRARWPDTGIHSLPEAS